MPVLQIFLDLAQIKTAEKERKANKKDQKGNTGTSELMKMNMVQI